MTPRADGYIPPRIPTRAYKAPTGPGWVHEIKHDGYRLQVRRDATAPSSQLADQPCVGDPIN